MTYVYYSCENCDFYVRVTATMQGLGKLTSKEYNCPNCETRIKVREARIPRREFTVLTDDQFIKAVNGLGLPSETVTHIEPIIAMLKSSPIKEVKAFERDGRCFIYELTMENGVTLHLAASGFGAVVYKATRGNHAHSRTNEHSDQQQVRRQRDAEEHGTRGCGDKGVCCEVHRRVRENSDEVCNDDRWANLSLATRHGCAITSGTEMVQRADGRKAGPCTEESSTSTADESSGAA